MRLEIDNQVINIPDCGFVFLDDISRPYLVKIWGNESWLFYWHKDDYWVSLKRITGNDILELYPRALESNIASIYHKKHNERESKQPTIRVREELKEMEQP